MTSLQKSAAKGNNKPPARSTDQRDFVIDILRAAGHNGVSKLHFLDGSGPCCGRRVTQIGARVFEAERLGFVIEHRRVESSPFVVFVLISEPNPQTKSVQDAIAEQQGEAQLRLGITGHQMSEFLQHETGLDCARHQR